MLGRLGRPERRNVSYQDVWGRGDDWAGEAHHGLHDGLALSAVVACINLRANTIAQLPLKAYRLDASGRPVEMPTQPQLVAAPSMGPRSHWIRSMSISRDLFGNAFGAIVGRDAAGWPTAVEWLDPTKVTHRQAYVGAPVEFTLTGKPMPAEDVFVVPGMPVPGSPLGISPLERSGLVELAKRAQDFGADWLRNSAVPSMLLYADAELDQESADRIRASVQSSWRKRRPAVLGSGLKAEKIGVDANESQFLETMRHVQVDICQIFGVPPEKIGIASSGQSITYANREQQAQQFLVDTINAELVLVQEVLSAALPKPQFVRFSTGALLRSDLSTRYAAYAQALAGERPWLTVDEVRELEDRGPLPTD